MLDDRKDDASNNSEHSSNKISLTEKISVVFILGNQSVPYLFFCLTFYFDLISDLVSGIFEVGEVNTWDFSGNTLTSPFSSLCFGVSYLCTVVLQAFSYFFLKN